MKAIFAVLARAVLLALLTQAPFWLAQMNVPLQRALFNLDMVLALIIATWHRRLGLVALLGAWVLEIVRDASRTYHFVDETDFLTTVRFAGMVGLRYVLSWQVALVVLGLGVCIWLVRRLLDVEPGRAPYLAAALFGSACVCGATDALNGSNGVLGKSADRFVLGVNVAGSAGWNSLRDALAAYRAGAEPMQHFEAPETYPRIVAWKQAHPSESVLLVLVESMGLPQSPNLRSWLYGRIETPAVTRAWEVESGSEGFVGPTTYGELRVLCGLRGYYTKLKPSDETQCIPRVFAAAGQQSLGLHGFPMRMFDRRTWWPALGLVPQSFDADERVPGNVHCNDAFPGVCDSVVLRRAVALADSPGRFVYAVTLDTHLPLPWKMWPVQADLQRICDSEHVSPVACRMVDRLGHVLNLLATDLATMSRPPLVIAVGDHMPPFVVREDREAFDPNRVTMVTLQPRAQR
jgi:hypothetical protein